MQLATAQGNAARAHQLHTLSATVEGRYDFTDANLNRIFPSVQPRSFQDWFLANWNG